MARELRSALWRCLGFFVGLELMITPAILWWPDFAPNVANLKPFTAGLPVLGDMLDMVDEGGVVAYVIAQHFFKAINALGAAAAILFAIGVVAGEVHRGTLEVWLARPVTRTRLLTERYALGLLSIAIPVFASSATIPWLLSMVDESMQMADLMRCSLHSFLFVLCIYSVTFLWSALDSQPIRIAVVLLFLAVFQFAIYMIKTITNYSLFRLVDVETYMEIVDLDRLDWAVAGGMIALNAACFIAALAAFKRRIP